MRIANLVLLSMCLMGNGNCAKIPDVKPEIWAGNAMSAAIERGQEDRQIKCFDTRFDEFVCMTGNTLEKVIEPYFYCDKWAEDRPFGLITPGK